jgi:hypothetical protein
VTVEQGIELVKALAWPITALVALVILRRPVSQLIEVIGRRATKISLFKIELSLGNMTRVAPGMEAKFDRLRMVAVEQSGVAPILAGLSRSADADYLTISLGADSERAWITSRLFILAAILERSRTAHCLAFTGEGGAFLGAAAVRDVRFALGVRFPEYEQALFKAQAHVWSHDIGSGSAGDPAAGAAPNLVFRHLDRDDFRGGELSEDAVNAIAHQFLNEEEIVSRNPQAPSAGWVYLDRSKENPPKSSTFERAERLTAGSIVALLGERMNRGSVPLAGGKVDGETMTRAIVRQSGALVALRDATGAFQGLCDRRRVLEAVALGAANQAAEP